MYDTDNEWNVKKIEETSSDAWENEPFDQELSRNSDISRRLKT